MKNKNGFSLVELMMGITVFLVLSAALLFSVMTFKKSGAVGARNAKMHEVMKNVSDRLVNASQGSSWFSMDSLHGTDFTDPNFPGITYDVTIGAIADGVRKCTIVVRSYIGGTEKKITSNLVISPRRGRDVGGTIKVVARRESDNGPAEDIYCEAIPLEGSVKIPGRTNDQGEALFVGTQLGTTTITCDTEVYPTCRYYFTTTTDVRANPKTPVFRRGFSMRVAPGAPFVKNIVVAEKGKLEVRVFKRDGAADNTVPVGYARLYLESSNCTVAGSNLANPYSTDGFGVFSKFVPPCDYRVTVLGSSLADPDKRVGMDQPGSPSKYIGYFRINDAETVTKSYWLVKMGDSSGTARMVNYDPGTDKMVVAGTANSMPIKFKQDSSLVYYTDGATPVFNMNETQAFSKGGDYVTHFIVTNPSNGKFGLKRIAPGIIHATAAVHGSPFEPENARAYVTYYPSSSVPAGLTPIVVHSPAGAYPQSRANIQFRIVIANPPSGKPDNVFYPYGTGNANFTFPVITDGWPTFNQDKTVDVLGNNAANFVTFTGQLERPVADGGGPFTAPNATYACYIKGFVYPGGAITSSPAGFIQIQTSGGVTKAIFDPSGSVPWNSDTYTFSNIVPTLGADRTTLMYTAVGDDDTPANYHLDYVVNYNRWNNTTGAIETAYRTNDPADNFTADFRITYDNKWFSPDFVKTGVQFSGGVAPEFSGMSKLHRVFSGNTKATPVPGNPGTITQNIVIGSMVVSTPTHRARILTWSGPYQNLAWDYPLVSRPTGFVGTIGMRLLTLVRLRGRVTNSTGKPLPNIKVWIGIDTRSTEVTTTNSLGEYDKSVWVAHTPNWRQFWMVAEDPNGAYQQQASPNYRISDDLSKTPADITCNFTLSYSARQGL